MLSETKFDRLKAIQLKNGLNIAVSFIKKHKKKTIAALILLLIAVLFIKAALGGDKGAITVSLGEVTKGSFEQSVFATGKLEVKDAQEFYTETAAVVKEIYVNPGERVSPGQVILELDDSDLAFQEAKDRALYHNAQTKLLACQANIRMYQREYDLASKHYERIKVLFEAGAVSQKELETAEKDMNEWQEKLSLEREANLPLLQTQLEEARLGWQKSQELLEQAKVTSTIEGVLLNLPVKKNQRLERGALLAVVGDTANLQVEIGINEIDAALLEIGDKVEITYNTSKDIINGTVTYIAPMAELVKLAQGEQSQVKIKVDVDKNMVIAGLKPGYSVNLKIVLNHKDEALLVPYEAVTRLAGKDIVYVVDSDGTVREKEIVTGLSNDLFYEVVSGLNPGDMVVINPGQQIKEGIKVKVHVAGK